MDRMAFMANQSQIKTNHIYICDIHQELLGGFRCRYIIWINMIILCTWTTSIIIAYLIDVFHVIYILIYSFQHFPSIVMMMIPKDEVKGPLVPNGDPQHPRGVPQRCSQRMFQGCQLAKRTGDPGTTATRRRCDSRPNMLKNHDHNREKKRWIQCRFNGIYYIL